jgi:hypothetical protein
VIASAARAGIGHVVKITSKASADSPIARRRDHTEIENGLIASGLGYTLLRNNAYMQNFFMLAPSISTTNSFGSSTGQGRVGMVDRRDVAGVAARIVASPDPHTGKTYWPTGPESLSYADAAKVLSTVLGRTITFHPLTFDEHKQATVDVGVPEHVAEMNAQADAGVRLLRGEATMAKKTDPTRSYAPRSCTSSTSTRKNPRGSRQFASPPVRYRQTQSCRTTWPRSAESCPSSTASSAGTRAGTHGIPRRLAHDPRPRPPAHPEPTDDRDRRSHRLFVPYTFAAAFRRQHGQPPGRWRQQQASTGFAGILTH